jgi:hypothetical protein
VATDICSSFRLFNRWRFVAIYLCSRVSRWFILPGVWCFWSRMRSEASESLFLRRQRVNFADRVLLGWTRNGVDRSLDLVSLGQDQ